MATNKIEIRKRIRELLLGNTGCGQSVFTSRPTPVWIPELPAICISTPREQFKMISCSPKTFERTPDVNIIILAEANEDLEDVLDTIQEQIESILPGSEFLPDPESTTNKNTDALVNGLEPTGSETEIIIDTKVPLGASTLRYICSYEKQWPVVVNKNNDDTDEMTDFNAANTRFDINNDNVADVDNTVTVRSEP